MRPPLPLLLAVVLGVLCRAVPCAAEEGALRTLTFPREGFSLEVPRDWEVEQYGEALVRVHRGSLALVVRPAPPDSTATEGGAEWVVPGATRAQRVPGTPGAAVCRSLAFVERPGRPALLLDATCPGDDEEGRRVLDRVVDSLDVRPLPDPKLHADWRHGWTLQVPEGWALAPDPATGGRPPRVRFRAADGSAILRVDAWADVAPADAPADRRDLEAWVALGVKGALAEGDLGEAIASHDPPEVAEIGLGAGVEGRLAGMRIRTASQEKGGGNGFASVLVSDRFRVVLLAREEGSPASKAGFDALRSFEPDTVSALRSAPAPTGPPPTDAFDRKDGPQVVFSLPASFRKGTPKSPMRLGQWSLPGEPPPEVAAFWFGAGGGGGLEANLERWRKMVTPAAGQEPAKAETVEPAPGIRVTVLDVRGAYSADAMPGSGEKVTIPDARMIAAVIECPGGPVYVKAFGASGPMDAAAADVRAWILSFRPRT
jgi:hypothetical protein